MDLAAGYAIVDGLWISSQDPVLRRLAAEFITTANVASNKTISFLSLDSEHADWPLVASVGAADSNTTVTLSMRRLLREWQEELQNDIARQTIVSKWVNLLLEARRSKDLNKDGTETLLPAIKHVSNLYIMRLSTFIHHQAIINFPTKNLGGGLAVTLVRDLPNGICMCAESDLEDMKLSADEAFDIAFKNMKQRTGPLKFEPLHSSNHLLVSTYDDSYDSSRLVVPEIFEQVSIPKQHLLIVTPDRDRLLLVDSRDRNSILESFKFADERQTEAAKPHGLGVFRFSTSDANKLEPFDLSFKDDAELSKLAQRVSLLARAKLYETQRSLLEEWDASRVDQDTFHARYNLFQSENGIFSAVSITRGVPTTLPVCDQLFLNEIKDGAVVRCHQVELEKLRLNFPTLLRAFSPEEQEWVAPDHLPRYFVVGNPDNWPTEQDFEKMGAVVVKK